MKPIWYFVGLMLIILGTLVVIAGLLAESTPHGRSVVLAHLHPNLWWGGLMLIVGAVYLLANRNKRV